MSLCVCIAVSHTSPEVQVEDDETGQNEDNEGKVPADAVTDLDGGAWGASARTCAPIEGL